MPLSIADLSEVHPLKGVCFVGSQGVPQPDGSKLIASDEGKGIINHIWMTVDHGVPDSITKVRVVIDGKTVIETGLRGVGRLMSGFLRPPFDTTMSGGTVCDVQLPYSESFQIYYTGPYLFCAIIWRPLPLDTDIGSFADDSYRYAAEQESAEQAYWKKETPWGQLQSDSLSGEWVLQAGGAKDIATVTGPSFIHTLEFFNRMPWKEYHDSLYLQIFWDDNIRPHIDVPLNDFFGFGNGQTTVNAFQQRSSATKVLSYMPMPFTGRARVCLVNRSEKELKIAGRIVWSPLDTVGKVYGVLATDFRRSIPTKFEVDHTLVEQLGKGRYIGCHTTASDYYFHYFLEGDFQFRIDDQNAWRYTGTEDYFNAAWYFEDSIFSLPFAGCTIFPSSFYRFHYLDAVDFTKSFSLSAEHGNLNSVRANFRTVAFMYVEPQHIWTERDTILRGDGLKVSGRGLKSSAAYDFELNGQSIGVAITDSEGRLDQVFVVALPAGKYQLDANGLPYNRSIVILNEPHVEVDTSKKVGPFNFRDRLPVSGTGFRPFETLRLLVDTFLITDRISADERGIFQSLIEVPYTPSFTRRITVQGNAGSIGSSPEYEWSRTFTFEVEDQLLSEGAHPAYQGWWGHHWSESAIAFMYSGEPSSVLDVGFEIPVDDTFNLELYYTTNKRYGNYGVFIDNVKLGVLNGYSNHHYEEPHRAGPLRLGPVHLLEGVHTLRFVGEGRDPEAVENSLGPDNFRLIPVTDFQPRGKVDSTQISGRWVVHPSPMIGPVLTVSYTGRNVDIPEQIALIDALGRFIELLDASDNIGTSASPVLKLKLPEALSPGTYFLKWQNQQNLKFVKLGQ